MNLAAISHRGTSPDLYALNENEIVINIRTGKDITAVSVIHEDPFAGGATGFAAWDGIGEAMTICRELKCQPGEILEYVDEDDPRLK